MHYQTDLLANWHALDAAASLNRRLNNIPRRIRESLTRLDELEGWSRAVTRRVDPEECLGVDGRPTHKNACPVRQSVMILWRGTG